MVSEVHHQNQIVVRIPMVLAFLRKSYDNFSRAHVNGQIEIIKLVA